MQENYENIENGSEEKEGEVPILATQERDPDSHVVKKHKPVQPTRLGSGQKFAVFVLVIFAIAAIGMWMMQFKKSITQPFAYKGETNNTQNLSLEQEDSEEALRNKDTDKDGLSDWDELYLYKTSPYLEDSDSDGFSDKEEVASKNDPNCPTGRDCYSLNIPESEEENNSIDQLNIQNNDQNQGQELQNILGGQGDAATLRKMLLDAGMDKEVLDQISDEDLIKSYQEILNQ